MSVKLPYQYKIMMRTNRLLYEKAAISEKMKNEITNQQINLTDSLIYASYIQKALLPSDKFCQELLPESFILFKPKEIVSGDFYWIGQNMERIFVAVADCTGHGVPGAFISMIGIELLNKTILDCKIEKPSEILSVINKGIHRTFHYGTEETAILRNGIEMGLCSINKKKNEVEFAGSYHPLYLIRNKEITEIKGDKLTVGVSCNSEFTNNTIKLHAGDTIYMFTDGYVDQFGGPHDKKFMHKRFRHLLLTICNFPMKEQKKILNDTINAWAGKRDQVDDILVIGFNI